MKQILIILTLTICGQLSFCQTVELDDEFGKAGKVFLNATGIGYLSQIFSLSDEKILLAGVTSNAEDPVLIRLYEDGSKDHTFGAKGSLVIDLAYNEFFYGNWVVQPDGKMILATMIEWPGESRVVLRRFLPDGSLDVIFGGEGKMVTKIFGRTNRINDLVLQPDGKIIFISSIKDRRYQDILLIRALPDGTLDTGFGTNGTSIIEVKGEIVEGLDGTLQSDGKLLVMAKSAVQYDRNYFLIRCHQNGSFDPEFGEKGIPISVTDYNFSTPIPMFLPKENKILVYGSYCLEEYLRPCSTIQKYTLDGRLDSTYHYDGILERKAIDKTLNPLGAVVMPNEDIVFFGRFKRETEGFRYNDFGFAKYSPQRIIDANFAKHGIKRTSLGSKSSILYDAVAQPNGAIIAVGSPVNIPKPGGGGVLKLPKKQKIPVVRYRVRK